MAVVDHQKLVALDDLALTLVDQIRECQTDMPARFDNTLLMIPLSPL